MTAIGNVTLNTVVYYPSARTGDVGFVWIDRTSPYNAGQGTLSYTGPTSKSGGKTKRVGFRLELPIVSTETDACACPGMIMSDSIATIYVDVDTASATVDRTDLADRIKDLVSSTVFRNAVILLDGVY